MIFKNKPADIIDDCTKDGNEESLTRCTAFELRILNDSVGIRSKNRMHLGKKTPRHHLQRNHLLPWNPESKSPSKGNYFVFALQASARPGPVLHGYFDASCLTMFCRTLN